MSLMIVHVVYFTMLKYSLYFCLPQGVSFSEFKPQHR